VRCGGLLLAEGAGICSLRFLRHITDINTARAGLFQGCFRMARSAVVWWMTLRSWS